MSLEAKKRADRWRALLPKVVLGKLDNGEWMASYCDEMVTGATKDSALQAMRAKVIGDVKPPRQRPYLKLCKPCNMRAAAAGPAAEIEGIKVCLKCAAALDEWYRAVKAFERNRRKAARRRRRRG